MPARRWGPTVRIAPLLGALAVGAALAVASLGACTPQQEGRVLARVGERAITAGELLAELRHTRGPSTLVEMIDAELIRQGAEAAGIEATEAELKLRLDRAVAQAGSEADFAALLENRGLTREQFVELLRTDLLLDKLARATMPLHEQEIEDFYAEHREEYARGEQVRARLILLGSRADAEAVLETLQLGGDFAGLASALSIDPATRDKGGDMGWFEREDYAPPIAEAAFALPPGETSGVIEVPDGWAIVRVEERREAGYRPLEEVREEIRGRIERAKLPPARAEWIRRARAEATVRITDPELRAATEAMLKYAPPPQPVSLLPVPPAQ